MHFLGEISPCIGNYGNEKCNIFRRDFCVKIVYRLTHCAINILNNQLRANQTHPNGN